MKMDVVKEGIELEDVTSGHLQESGGNEASAAVVPHAGGRKQNKTLELRKRVVIPEYLRKAITAAVSSCGAAYPETVGNQCEEVPSSPLIVFVNSKSGGRLGPLLTAHLIKLMNEEQVFDLSVVKPTDFVRYGLGCLEKLASSDECARLTRERLRILVAGGDGTVGWVLGSLSELHAEKRGPIPPVGIIPLGTGNDLARSFGWGTSFRSARLSAVRRWLLKATDGSTPRPLDSWQVSIRTAPNAQMKLPHALKPQQHLELLGPEDEQRPENAASFEGVFYNYFSIGMDAQVAYGFHSLRERFPWLARGPLANKDTVAGKAGFVRPVLPIPVLGSVKFSCNIELLKREYYFCRGVSTVLKLQIQKKQTGEWEEVLIPSSVRAVVILNLQSYAGGRNPWGHPHPERMEKKGYVEAKSNDGLLEVFGLRDGWHTAFVMVSLLKAVRLAQAEALRLELHGEVRKKVYMQMDGEPWQHELNSSGDPVIVDICRVSTPSALLAAN